MKGKTITLDGNEAAAYIAFRTNEVIGIYPITPSSPMGELSDQWAALGDRNLWGQVPLVQEMQSEGGVAGSVHGALQTGSLTTTFTASQGLLLMIPNMFKIAGELTSTVFHIAARSVATHALSIFGDHSDVMAARSTGWAMTFSNSIQEVMDFALISQAATLESRVPFLHCFDGFRTSHEVMKIQVIPDETIREMINDDWVHAHRARALRPEAPVLRGTAQNPDVFFQAREACNPFYDAVPDMVQATMDKFAQLTGRQYRLFDYVGAPDAERVVILMGSGVETAEETVDHLTAQGEKVGLLKVHLFRPFSVSHFLKSLPATVKALAVLDRTKEPGGAGEPLYQDIVTALSEGMAEGNLPMAAFPKVIGGRYGLSSKEFTPAMVKAVFDELAKPQMKNHFTVGINDDVSHTSLDFDREFILEPEDGVQALFWGLGADGTVSANKNSIKIIGEETDNFAQGYFVYDSKKSGSVTTSHLRFGPRPIKATYLLQRPKFVAVHQFEFFERLDLLDTIAEGGTLLINSTWTADEVFGKLPRLAQEQIIARRLKMYVIDGYTVAKETGMGGRINTIMQACFFALSGVLPRDQAIAKIKDAIKKTYGKRGESVVQRNFAAVDAALSHMNEVIVPAEATSNHNLRPAVSAGAPEFVQRVTAQMILNRGDLLPVSAMPNDGTFPVGTAQWEKRNIAQEIPVWEEDLCIQCGKCVLVCPHSVIRAKIYDADALETAPEGFKSAAPKWRELADQKYTLQVSAEDCTGCALCVQVCPAKDKKNVSRKAINMAPVETARPAELANWDFFLGLPDLPSNAASVKFNNVKNVQLLQPLFEFSGACSGCGETPYVKLLSQLFGDRAIIANATGCSSIYGGNLPTTPWTTNKDGNGPAWSNSLFEDNAEFGLGMRLAVDHQTEHARRLAGEMKDRLGADLVEGLLHVDIHEAGAIETQRERVKELKAKLDGAGDLAAKDLLAVADNLVPRSIWIVGGDGWAYDIGYGGLDHVLASGYNVNVLVLDTEVYSNTGGQASKSTARGAVAKFAAGGKPRPKKDLGRMAMTYDCYVATLAMGASDTQTVKAFIEAESYDGPSILIAYSHCIAHGIEMVNGLNQQKLAVESGYWPLYRFDPRRTEEGKNPFQLDSKAPALALKEYIYTEGRYQMLVRSDPEAAAILLEAAQKDVKDRWATYERMAATV